MSVVTTFHSMNIIGGESPSIQIGVRSANNATEFCGLCGSRSGQLLRRDGNVADRSDFQQRENFTQSYLVEARDQILRPQRRECGRFYSCVIIDQSWLVEMYTSCFHR